MNEIKKAYHAPCLDRVELDQEISLILLSGGNSPWDDPEAYLHRESVTESHLA